MATINPSQDYDAIHTLTFAEASGTCNIRLYGGSSSAYSGTVYYREGTSGSWTQLNVSGTDTTFSVTSTTMQIGHSWNKSGNNYMTPSFYGQSTNLTNISISQKAVLSGSVGGYFMYLYARGCSKLTSLDVPDTSSVTSVGNYFMADYAYACTSLTSLSVPDTSSVTSVGTYFMVDYARGCTSLTSLSVPDTSGITSVGRNFMYYYAGGCTSLTSLSVPDTSSLTSVGDYFMRYYAYGCKLTSLSVPDTSSVTSVGTYFMADYASGCTSLTSLSVPDTSSLTSVGDNFMYYYAYKCSSLTSLSVPDTSGITSVGNNFMYYYASSCTSLTSLILPAVGWFANHNIDWSVPSGRLNYLKGYVTDSSDLTDWQDLTTSTSPNTLYINYIRSTDDVVLPVSDLSISKSESITVTDTPTVSLDDLTIPSSESITVTEGKTIDAGDRYWVGGTGNWSDATNHWSDSSNGTPNASFLPTSSDNVYFDANSGSGTCTINATANCLDFDASASSVTTFAGSSGLNVYGSFTFKSGATNSWSGNISFYSSSGTETIDTNGVSFASNSFSLNGNTTFQLLNDISIKQLYRSNGVLDANGNKVTINLTSFTNTISGGFTFYDLEILGGSYKTGTLEFTGNIEVTNTFTATGNSATNRILVKSNTLGTARTITANAVSLTNVDFQDITGAGSATWSGTSVGNALGNSGITFTTPVTRYWVATSGGNWSATSSWSDSSGGASGSSVPLCHDTVIFDANSISSASKTIKADMPIVPALDFSNVDNNPSLLFDVSYLSIFGSANFTGLGSFVSLDPMCFYGRGNHTITLNNLQPHSLIFYCYGGEYTFQDNITHAINGLTFYAGTININDNDFVGEYIVDQANGTTVYLGNGEFTLTGTGSVLQINSSTWYPENASLTINNTSTTIKRFKTNNLTWNSLTIIGNNVEIQDGGTFNTLNLNNAGQVTGTKFTTGKTFNIANFSTNGSAGNLAKIRSSSTTNATLNYTGTGVVDEDYMDIDYITGTPDNTWYVGTNSTDGGHNSQIYFTNAPTVVSESESITVTDTPTVSLDDLTIPSSESITVTDSPTLFIPEYSISTSDSVTLTEGSTYGMVIDVESGTLGDISESESITITDTPTLSLDDLSINKSETVTLSESLTNITEWAPDLPLVESESISITTTATVVLPNSLVINKSESITVSESLTNMTDWSPDLSVSKLEGVAITDAPTVSVQEVVALEIIEADVVTVTDTSNMENQLSGVESYETITVTDSPTVYTFQENLEIDTNEFVFTFESIDSNATIDLLTNDTIVVTDSVEVENCYSVEGAETVTITTVPSFRFGKGRRRVISGVGKNSPGFKVNPNKPRMNVRRYKR